MMEDPTDLDLEKELYGPLPFSKELKWIRAIMMMYGIKFFGEKKCQGWLSKFMTIVFVVLWFSFLIHIGNIMRKDKERLEPSLVIVIFLGGALLTLIYLRRNIEKIERTLLSISIFFSEKELAKIKGYNRFLAACFVGGFCIGFLVSVLYARSHLELFRTIMKKNGVPAECLTDVVMITCGLTIMTVYSLVIHGIMACAMTLYTMIMIIFRLFVEIMRNRILHVMTELTAENICCVRKLLRIYWNVKTRMDSLLNLLPFLWLSHTFISITVLFTLLVVDWAEHNERQPMVLFSSYLTFLCLICFGGKFFMMESADKAFEECLRAAFGLTDPRFRSTCNDEKLLKQIHLLHHELTNCPKSYNTIFGMARFSKKTIINYYAALVNFTGNCHFHWCDNTWY